MRDLISLSIIFRSTIGYQVPRLLQDGLSGLQRTTICTFLNLVRKQPRAQQTLVSCATAFASLGPIALRKLFGIQLFPRALYSFLALSRLLISSDIISLGTFRLSWKKLFQNNILWILLRSTFIVGQNLALKTSAFSGIKQTRP